MNGARSEPTRDTYQVYNIYPLHVCVSVKIYRKDMDPRVIKFRVVVNPRSFRKEERQLSGN